MLLVPFTLIYMLFNNIMHFIALMMPQSTTQIPPAVKKTVKLLMLKMTPCHT